MQGTLRAATQSCRTQRFAWFPPGAYVTYRAAWGPRKYATLTDSGALALCWRFGSGSGTRREAFRSPRRRMHTSTDEGLSRRLAPRQIAMMALGSAIGVGLLLGSSVTIRLAGPG